MLSKSEPLAERIGIQSVTKKSKKKNTYTEDDVNTYKVGLYYEKRLLECRGSTKRFFKTGPNKNHKSWRYFKLAIDQASELDLTGEEFVESQFWWFGKHHQVIPTPFDLTPMRMIAPVPIVVAEKWKALYASCPAYYVPPKDTDIRTEKGDVDFSYYERILKSTMKSFNLNEGDVFCIFGIELFSLEFLERQSAYQSLKACNFI